MYPLSHVYVAFPWKSTSSAERDAPDTSGGTPQLRGEHTGRDPPGTKSASAPHFTPLDNVNPGRQVTKPTSPNNIFAGSTEPCSREREREKSHIPWPRTLSHFPATSTHGLRRSYTCNRSPCRHSCHLRMHWAHCHQCSRTPFLRSLLPSGNPA